MYPDGLGGLAMVWSVVSLVWLLALSFLVWENRLFLKRLFPKNLGSFKDKAEEMLQEIKGLQEFKEESLRHVQRVGLKRYNPYQDTGGDQSFSLALLDAKGNGVVITSLHSRSGTRIFAKPVKSGKEDRFEFSDEEEQVVTEAMLDR